MAPSDWGSNWGGALRGAKTEPERRGNMSRQPRVLGLAYTTADASGAPVNGSALCRPLASEECDGIGSSACCIGGPTNPSTGSTSPAGYEWWAASCRLRYGV